MGLTKVSGARETKYWTLQHNHRNNVSLCRIDMTRNFHQFYQCGVGCLILPVYLALLSSTLWDLLQGEYVPCATEHISLHRHAHRGEQLFSLTRDFGRSGFRDHISGHHANLDDRSSRPWAIHGGPRFT